MSKAVVDTEMIKFPQDLLVQKSVEEWLHEFYPGHFWHVDANVRQGFINIKNLFLSGLQGYRIALHGQASSSEVRQLTMVAGGEILERYGMPRGAFNAGAYEGLKTDFAGRHSAHEG